MTIRCVGNIISREIHYIINVLHDSRAILNLYPFEALCHSERSEESKSEKALRRKVSLQHASLDSSLIAQSDNRVRVEFIS